MRVIGVLDLLAGRAVHAVSGRREQYRPVASVAGSFIEPGDSLALARAYLTLGVTDLYVADLDAILACLAEAPPTIRGVHASRTHQAIIEGLASLGAPLWLDAGVSTVDDARRAIDIGLARIIVGLETLPSFTALEDICTAVGRDRVAFSLDLRDGKPIVRTGDSAPGEPVHAIAARAAQAGAGAVIVLDLARVGTGRGLDLDLIGRVREATPGVTLVAGGGVRGPDDLVQLAQAGCDAALVATALQDGRIRAVDVATTQRLHP